MGNTAMSKQSTERSVVVGRLSDEGGRFGEDRGWVLPMIGLLIVPLIVMTAFAVDIGAWYAQSAKLQRASDNAALAGVVWMPNRTKARAVATESLERSGYDPVDFSFSFPTEQELAVSGSEVGTRYFSNVFMDGDQHLTRSGTATFNKPVPLGSPTNRLGNDVSGCAQFQPVAAAPCGPQAMLWQAIQGPYQSHADGDPYTTLCPGTSVSINACGTVDSLPLKNEDYRKDGYEFAIDVPAADVGKPITLQAWDATQSSRRSSPLWNTRDERWVAYSSPDCNNANAPWNGTLWSKSFTSTNCQTGDSAPYSNRNSLPMQFQVFDNDGSDLTVNFDTSICEHYIPRGSTNSSPTLSDTDTLNTYKNKWVGLCTFTPTKAGIYPMRVKSSNITTGGTFIPSTLNDKGWNAYAMKLVTAGKSTLYNLNHISIWTNTPGSTSRFYLAKITEEHRGKKIVLDLFDPGDGTSGNFKLQVLAPPKTSPFNTPAAGNPLLPPIYGTTIPATNTVTSCQANTNGSLNKGGGTLTNAPNCEVTTRSGGTQYFQNSWLRYEIVIDPNYSCSTDCWWTIKYDFGGTTSLPNDRTVWSLAIVGDPVHLVS